MTAMCPDILQYKDSLSRSSFQETMSTTDGVDSLAMKRRDITKYAQRAAHIAAATVVKTMHQKDTTVADPDAKNEAKSIRSKRRPPKKEKPILDLTSKAGGGKFWGDQGVTIVAEKNELQSRHSQKVPLSEFTQSMYDKGEIPADPDTYIDSSGHLYRDGLTGKSMQLTHIPNEVIGALREYIVMTFQSTAGVSPCMEMSSYPQASFDGLDIEERPESEMGMGLAETQALRKNADPQRLAKQNFPSETSALHKLQTPAVRLSKSEKKPTNVSKVDKLGSESVDAYAGTKTKGLLIAPGHHVQAVASRQVRQPNPPNHEMPSRRAIKVILQPPSSVENRTDPAEEEEKTSAQADTMSQNGIIVRIPAGSLERDTLDTRQRLRVGVDMNDEEELPLSLTASAPQRPSKDDNVPDERPSTTYENYREAATAAYEMHMENARGASPVTHPEASEMSKLLVPSSAEAIPYPATISVNDPSSIIVSQQNELDFSPCYNVGESAAEYPKNVDRDAQNFMHISRTILSREKPKRSQISTIRSEAKQDPHNKPHILSYSEDDMFQLDSFTVKESEILLAMERESEEFEMAQLAKRREEDQRRRVEVQETLTGIIKLIELKERETQKQAQKCLGSIMSGVAKRLKRKKEQEVAATAASTGGFLNWVKPEKPKHPPVRHTSMRLYNPEAIKAKMSSMRQQQPDEKQVVGGTTGMTLAALFAISNKVIYEDMDDEDEDEDDNKVDTDDGDDNDGEDESIPDEFRSDRDQVMDARKMPRTAMTDTTETSDLASLGETNMATIPSLMLPSEKAVIEAEPSGGSASIMKDHGDKDRDIVNRVKNFVRNFIDPTANSSIQPLENSISLDGSNLEGLSLQEYYPTLNLPPAERNQGDKFKLDGTAKEEGDLLQPEQRKDILPKRDASQVHVPTTSEDTELMGVKKYANSQLPPKRVSNCPKREIKQIPTDHKAVAGYSSDFVPPAGVSPRAPLTAKPVSAVRGRRMLHPAPQPMPSSNSPNTSPPKALVGHRVPAEKTSRVSEINEKNAGEDNKPKEISIEEMEVGTNKGVVVVSNAGSEPTDKDKMNVATTQTDTRRLESELLQLEQGFHYEETRQKALLESYLDEVGERIHVPAGTCLSLLGDNPEQQLRELTETSERHASSSNRYPVVPPSFKMTVEHLGNKAPLHAAGSNTTMSDPRPFHKQNFTDIGIAIENMRPPRNDGEEDHEALPQPGEAQTAALAAKAAEAEPVAEVTPSPEFDPTEPFPRDFKGPDSGVVLNIRSGLSSSQQVHLAFLDEEQRRKKDLAHLRDNMAVNATNVPIGAKPAKVSTSAVKAEKGKKGIKAPNVPQLELIPPAPSDIAEAMFNLSPYAKKMKNFEFDIEAASQPAYSPKQKPSSPTAERADVGNDLENADPSRNEMSARRSPSAAASTQPMGLTNVTVVIRSNKQNKI